MNARSTQYHATTVQRARRILRQGIIPNKVQPWNESQTGSVYLTPDKEEATEYVLAWRSRPGDGVAIAEVQLPECRLARLQRDPDWTSGKAYMYPGTIARDWVKSISTYSPQQHRYYLIWLQRSCRTRNQNSA